MNDTHSDEMAKRHQEEKEFHDVKYTTSNSSPSHYQVNPTYRIFEKIKQQIGNIKGKKLLEYGCGTGWITAELAAMAGFIESFDISDEAIGKTSELLKKHNLDKNCCLKVMSAEKLDYSENTFDIVIGFAILHHLDLALAIPELNRVLKPDGVAYFAEPLGYNPFINYYRKITPQYRTSEERPLIFEELFKFTRNFKYLRHKEYYLVSLLPFVLLYIPRLKNLYYKISKVCFKIDQKLLERFPALGKWAWYSIIEFRK